MKKNEGITLTALVITIIVLLIIAGITISVISEKNGIINGANDSKNKTTVVEEKQILNMSVAAIAKSSKAKVEEANLKNYCNQNIGEEGKDYTLEKENQHFKLKFSVTGNEYVILEDGTILTKQEYDSKINKNNI